jgi:acyl carrier protein
MEYKTEIKEKVLEIVSEQFDTPLEEISLIDRLMKDLNADSLDIVEVIMAIEEEFCIEITDIEAENLCIKDETVEDLINLVIGKLK